MTSAPPAILGLATAEAPHAYEQSALQRAVVALFAGREDLDGLAPVFERAGIGRRTLALPLAEYARGLGPQQRDQHFRRVAGALLREVAARAVPRPLRSRVTHVVTVTSTGVATPTLECSFWNELGFSPAARRVPLFGLGCAGGCAGLAVAADLARAGGLVAVLCVELTSLTYLRGDRSRRNFVACALFGDGAGGALVGSSALAEPLARIGPQATRLLPDSLDLMGWDPRDDGWAVVFSPRIPAVVRREAAALVAAVGEREALRHFALHPGGRKVLEAYRDALGLDGAALAPATETLRRHGNMSAATVFFVLERILRAPAFEPGPGVATAFGPGFSAEALALDLVAPPAP